MVDTLVRTLLRAGFFQPEAAAVRSSADVRASVAAILEQSESRLSAAVGICQASSELLPVSGAAISVIDEQGIRGTVCVSDQVMTAVEELQFTTGIGPCVDAFTGGMPILVPDLSVSVESRWPGFSEQAVAAGVRAIFAFPLRVGAVRLGALDFYRASPGGFSPQELADALLVADGATAALVHLYDGDPGGSVDGDWWDPGSFFHSEVHQATGMIMAQRQISAADALVRLRASAFALGESVSDVARSVIAGDRRFGVADGHDGHPQEDGGGQG